MAVMTDRPNMGHFLTLAIQIK